MPEAYDPLKSAELTTEQNYKYDRRYSEQRPGPGAARPRKSRWIRCGRSRRNAAAGSARSVDEKAPSLGVHLNVMVTPEEQALDLWSAWPRRVFK